jgi:hypothetical protein
MCPDLDRPGNFVAMATVPMITAGRQPTSAFFAAEQDSNVEICGRYENAALAMSGIVLNMAGEEHMVPERPSVGRRAPAMRLA